MSGPLRIPQGSGGKPPEQPKPQGNGHGNRHWRWIVAGSGGFVAVLALLLVFVLGRGPVGPLQQEVSTLKNQVTDLQRTPAAATASSCTSASTWLATITTQEKASQWEVAASNARAALSTAGLCSNDKTVLAQKAIVDDLEGLFSTPFSPDAKAQQLAVDRFESTRRFAKQYNASLPSARQIAGRAYGSGEFLLAKNSFEEALAAGEVVATDQAQVQFYLSTLHNLGKWWATHATGDTRTEGLRLLAAANCLDRKYRVGSGEAWGSLKELLGPDESHWPAPATTPLNPPGESCGADQASPAAT